MNWMSRGMAIAVLVFSIGVRAEESLKVVNHSFSSPADVLVKHLDLDVKVDFDAKKVIGRATLQIENKTKASKFILDTRDLTVKAVTLGKEKATPYTLGEAVKYVGQALTIDIQPNTKVVHIDYETRPDAAALQWLAPSQTAGKQMPFLFTQSEAIMARTWIPCQDTPEVRMTYDAKLEVPKGMMAVMSAENRQTKSPSGRYRFHMPQAVPSYLLALAVGDLEFAPVDKRSGVYAEPSVVKKAAWEFADMGKMVTAAEKMYGPYRWGRYDVLVLPPSFPFGGMENPRLTFLSPTILAGDRSLMSLITHELSHSWSGNLVTNATWDDFWLNEGFTTYFENRIIESIYGKPRANMEALLGLHKLEETLADPTMIAADKQLHLNMKDRDPDDAVNDVAYEKGALFLKTIEETVGREKWDAFLADYFKRHAFHSMTTAQFLADFENAFFKNDPDLKNRLQIDAWVYGPTIPSNAPKIQSEAFAKTDVETKRWIKGAAAKDLQTEGWVTSQWLRFLRELPKKIKRERMAELDQAFKFTESGNAEILTEWLEHSIRNKYDVAYPKLKNFLTTVGRRKYLKPLYQEMAKTKDGTIMAKEIYTIARPGYHSVSTGTIDDVLKWNPKS